MKPDAAGRKHILSRSGDQTPKQRPHSVRDGKSTASARPIETGTPTDPGMSEADTESLMHSTYNALLDSLEEFLGRQG